MGHAKIEQVATSFKAARASCVVPGHAFGQSTRLSSAVQKLVNKTRTGEARLTWTDGRTQNGYIVRVTDQFIASRTSRKPLDCATVGLSENRSSEMAQWAWGKGEPPLAIQEWFYMAFVAPFAIGEAVAGFFKRSSPPVNPPLGSWALSKRQGGIYGSTLELKGSTVEARTEISKRGRWSVERERLILDGEPASETRFHIDCEGLDLEKPTGKLWDFREGTRAAAPIVGHWHGTNYALDFEPNGRATEQRVELRRGTFESSGARVKIHWDDVSGLGGAEWAAQIEHRRIVAKIGGTLAEYRYVRPGREFDF